jgi:Ras-related protein Rab-8A
VYSVTDRKTFSNIENWLKQISQHHSENISRIIVGNKSDCAPADRQVSLEEGKELAKKYSIRHMETSAKDNINITELFQALATEIRDNLK